MQLLLLLCTIFSTCISLHVQQQQIIFEEQSYIGVQVLVKSQGAICTLLDFEIVQQHRLLNSTSNPYSITRHWEEDGDVVIKIVGLSNDAINSAISKECINGLNDSEPFHDQSEMEKLAQNDEIQKIIDSGPPENRIDVVFMGDGYTSSERDRFFDDIRRLARDMWSDDTFASVRPLVNVWALFRPSVDSGIGTGGRAKNTAFGLYRDGTELRGIYCSKRWAAMRACKSVGPKACDFPSLIANDDYYGGLGGQFTISTRSVLSGTVVLRHELGHNFISVGEEYDGGQVYSGVNSAPSYSVNDLKWKHWLTEEKSVHEENQAPALQEYPWHDLAKGSKVYRFKTNGNMDRWIMRLSASGVESEGALEVTLDNEKLDWHPRGDFDRAFYEFSGDGLTYGEHTLEFRQGFPKEGTDSPIRQICSVEINEYGKDFHYNNTFIGAFPTFDLYGRKTLRPTNEGCLMRDMQIKKFCAPCMEGLWLQFLERVSLIDDVSASCSGQSATVSANLVPLGHLRNTPVASEVLSITWYFEGKEQSNLEGLSVFETRQFGGWQLKVKLTNPEIRKDRNNLSTSTKSFRVSSC